VELLAEGGITGLSVDAICLRAGVPRSTYYRRWPSALEVVADAFNEAARIDPLPDTGDLIGDVLAYATKLGAFFADPVFGACVSFLSAEARLRPSLRQRLRKDLASRRSANREMFARAAARGETLPDIEPDLVLDIINALAMTTDAAGNRLRTADYELVLRRLLIS
jgi:AcrR family transcriptional regulator